MNPRKKAGIGLLIGAALTATYGVVALVLPGDPSWLSPLAQIVTLVAGVLGFVLERQG